MGQYYMAVMIGEDENGNPIYQFVETYIGDGAKLTEHSYMTKDGTPASRILQVVENLLRPGGEWYQKPIVWAGDYADDEKDGENLYCLENKQYMGDMKPLKSSVLRYVVNHTKKLYVDKANVLRDQSTTFTYHPLPLLCAEGNGQGGGDYRGDDENNLVGSWARDKISMEGMKPNEDYNEILFNLCED